MSEILWGQAHLPRASRTPEQVCAHTGTQNEFQKFQKTPILAVFRGPKSKLRENVLKLARYTSKAIHILLGVQTTGAGRITPQNKYVHTQAHIFDAEISTKMAILAGFRGPKKSFSKMMPKHAQCVPRAIRTFFGLQSAGTNDIVPQNKYLHTQVQKLDVEISEKKAILAIFKGTNANFFDNDAETCTKDPRSFL